jgi:hypothetical protein
LGNPGRKEGRFVANKSHEQLRARRKSMKRIIRHFVVIAVTFSMIPVFAQTFYAGVLGGVNFADSKIDFHEAGISNPVVKHLTCFGGGAVVGVRMMDGLSLELQPMFQTYGGVYSMDSEQDMTMRVKILELPLFLKAGLGKKVRPHLTAGPILSVRLDSEVEGTFSGLTFKGDMNGILKKSVFGLGFAAGVDVSAWKGWFVLEGRYSFTLGNLNKGGWTTLRSNDLSIDMDTNPSHTFRMNNIQFILGYVLPLGGK